MDIATRYQPRLRAESYLNRDRDRNAMPDDSGAESESLTRRKFQRTTTDADNNSNEQFRKPTIPASATRLAADRRASVTNRRKSMAQREDKRVPSGPREYPGSPGKRFPSSTFSVPSAAESSNGTANRSFLPQPSVDSSELTRASFGNPSSNDDNDSPLTPAERTNGNFDFIPTVNFDDFQSRLAGFDGPSSLLGEFPAVGGGRALATEETEGMAKDSGKPGMGKQQQQQQQQNSEGRLQDVGRSASFRQRIGAGTGQTGQKAGLSQGSSNEIAAPAHPNVSLRSRRQSNVPQASVGLSQPLPVNTSRQPRKSIGPGMFSGIMDRKPSAQPSAAVPPESTKPSLTRSSSLSKPKKTIAQPSTSAGAELPRVSTLTATTASRQAKVKSLQPPPREPDPNTPICRSPGKGTTNRAHTPLSSGNRRQSMAASGRASGLGARTISPTDARRLKRMSMMPAPPMPSSLPPKEPATPQPQEEHPPSARLHEHFPHLSEPAPSLIPRKTSNSHTPTSARASPEGRFGLGNSGVVSLSSKSSYQSLINATATNSRLPTPKTRSLHSSNAQYVEDDSFIPPVPAIPKSYESPKEHEVPFFSTSRKSSAATFNEPPPSATESSHSFLPSPAYPAQPSRSSLDMPPQTPRRGSHRRNETIGSPKEATASSAKPKQYLEMNGRRNNNLQPLRLPPLNLLPLSASFASQDPTFPKPTQELDRRDDPSAVQTPEPKRVPKTPSTPMTASKATFYRRQEEERAKQKQARSSTSHNVLRDMMGFDESVTRFFDDSEPETIGSGMPIPQPKQQQQQQQQQQTRSTITPFASGSLPKQSGESARLHDQPSGEHQEGGGNFNLGAYENSRLQSAKPQGPRPRTSGTITSYKTATETPHPGDSPIVEQTSQPTEQKKEGGLRRKLSLGWRRTSSKAANHPDNKSSPPEASNEKEKAPKGIPKAIDMPPPKLPASATWSGELPSLPSSARPSLDSGPRKIHGSHALSNVHTGSGSEHEQQAPAAPKTRALHSEQPQPISGNRASTWGNFSFNNRSNPNRSPANGVSKSRQPVPSSGINALIKDKDDLAADEEMRRLSQKRRNVDSAARETEELKRRAVARTPMSPDSVLHDRNCSLNIFERGEIVDYQKEGVYFTGTKTARKIIGSVTPSPTGDAKDSKAGNYGYDDERGDYNIVMGDHLAYRYEVVDVLGKGSFGQVVRCVDHKDGGIVAVKIIRNKKRFHQQALVEVGILQRLRDWDPQGSHATLSITSSFYFRSHLCIVTPCLSINLYEFIRAHNFTGFSLPLIRRFSRQLLACLVLLQNKHIIHCDLKPENILLCEARKADVRVIDFGSSCREEEKVYTYIQSRFYRSPEVILGSSYGLGIDMWSFGCILAELFTGYPIFPGENEQEQLACIMEIFGPPDRHLVERCTRKKLFFDSVGKPRVTVSSKGRRRRPSSKTLQQALKSDDDAFLDFITRCLRWDPDRRLKPTDAVNHPFITNQPMQRPGIPEEARRSARIRSTTTGSGTDRIASSPIKRSATHSTALAPQHAVSGTPRTDRVRSAAVPESSQSTLRSVPAAGAPSGAVQSSPSKLAPSTNFAGRRQSSVASAAVAGSKRASNGLVLSSALGSGASGVQGGGGQFGVQQMAQKQQQQQGRPGLAAMAARESMASASASASASATSVSQIPGSGAGAGASAAVSGHKDGASTSMNNSGAGSARWRL